MRLSFCCLLLLICLVSGCTAPEEPAAGLTFNGTVTCEDLEGGFWGIAGDEGGYFLPVNLPQDCQVEGLHVHVTVVPVEEGVSSQMWGKQVEITGISLI